MAFYGTSFIFDGVSSDLYDLKISDIDAQAINKMMAFPVQIIDQKIYRRAKPYHHGTTPSQKLLFDFTAYSNTGLDSGTWGLAAKWLFSNRDYKNFQIDQYDLNNIYFKVILLEPQVTKVGNIIKGFQCSVTSDAPYGYYFPKTLVWNWTSDVVSDTKVFINLSEDTGVYLQPTFVITMNSVANGTIRITDVEDDNRYSEFTGLAAGETITVDSSHETLFSSTGLLRLANFNKKFPRFLPNINTLKIEGNVAQIAVTYQFVCKRI